MCEGAGVGLVDGPADDAQQLRQSSASSDAPEKENDTSQKEEQSSRALCTIAFLGSIDDAAIYIPLLVGKSFSFASLFVGASLSVGIILAISFGMGWCAPIAWVLERIPLFVIVLGL